MTDNNQNHCAFVCTIWQQRWKLPTLSRATQYPKIQPKIKQTLNLTVFHWWFFLETLIKYALLICDLSRSVFLVDLHEGINTSSKLLIFFQHNVHYVVNLMFHSISVTWNGQKKNQCGLMKENYVSIKKINEAIPLLFISFSSKKNFL